MAASCKHILFTLSICHFMFNSQFYLVVSGHHSEHFDKKYITHFDEFVEYFSKPYKRGTDEYNTRKLVFEKNVSKYKMQLNNTVSETGAEHGITQFSDLTIEEFIEMYLSANIIPNDVIVPVITNRVHSSNHWKLFPNSGGTYRYSVQEIPNKWDWRNVKGRSIVTSVKNQHSCGACWAFSTIETVESMFAKKTGQLRDLSVQQMIDCADDGNLGCKGGLPCEALFWMNTTRVGIVTEAEYPLKDKSQYCTITNSSIVKIKDYTCIREIGEEDNILQTLYHVGPVIVSVDATLWMDYLGGIIQHNCGNRENHAVQIVGYDKTGEVPYYIVRNSWGEKFGINGYLHVKIGGNVCGIAQSVSTVSVL